MKVTPGKRKLLFVGLIAAFLLQSSLVFLDPTGRETPALTETESLGRKIWLKHNCQSCHQLFGFGGFLGPDLTNRAHLLTPAALKIILQIGPKQMPSIDLSLDEANELHAYLNHMNKTGRSQPNARLDGKDSIPWKMPWFTYKPANKEKQE
jgi:nitric oxide reductase subunit C